MPSFKIQDGKESNKNRCSYIGRRCPRYECRNPGSRSYRYGLEVFGIMRGYQGLIDDDIFRMEGRSVANIIQRGGTILKTARCKEFYEPAGRKIGYDNLKKRGINGLVIIGGDGSFRGAVNFSKEFDIPCVGLAGTIDKDISGTCTAGLPLVRKTFLSPNAKPISTVSLPPCRKKNAVRKW